MKAQKKYEDQYRSLSGSVNGLNYIFGDLKNAVRAVNHALFSGLTSSNGAITRTIKSVKSLGRGFNAMMATALGAFDRVQDKLIGFNHAMELSGRIKDSVAGIYDRTIGKYADFETALIGVGKTSGNSGEKLEYLGRIFDTLSHRIPVTSEHLLGLAENAAQMGVAEGHLAKFAETYAKIESASNLKGPEGATFLARIIGNSKDHIKNIDRVGSALIALGNSFKTTEAEITGVAIELSKTMTGSGALSHELLALSAVIREMGSAAEVSSSVLGQAFRRIGKAVATAGTQFGTLEELTGLSGKALKEAYSKSSVDVFYRFLEGLSKLSMIGAESKLAIFDLKGDEVMKVLPPLSNQVKRLREALDLAALSYEQNRALSEEAAAAFATLNAKIQITKNILSSLGTSIGSILAPAFGLLLDGVNAVAKGLLYITKYINQLDFEALVKPAKALGVALAFIGSFALGGFVAFKGGLAAVIPPLLAWLKSLRLVGIAVKGLTITMGVLSKVFSLAALKVTLVAAGLVAIVGTIDLVARNLKNLDGVWTWIVKSVRLGIAKFKSVLQGFADWIGKKFGKSLIDPEDIAATQKEIANLSKAREDAAGKIDTGMLGGMEKFLKSALSGPDSYILDQGSDSGPGKKKGDTAGLTSEKIKEINSQYKKLAASVEMVTLKNAQAGKGAIEAAFMQKSADMAKLATLEKNLKLAKNLTAEHRKTLGILREQAGLKLESVASGVMKNLDHSNERLHISLLQRRGEWQKIADISRDHALYQINSLERQLKLSGMLTAENRKRLETSRSLIDQRHESDSDRAKTREGGSLAGNLQTLSKNLASILPESMKGISTAIGSAAKSGAVMYLSAADTMMDAIKGLIDFLPGIINKAASIFEGLTNLPEKLFHAVLRLFTSLTTFLTSIFDNIGEYVTKIIMSAADFVMNLPTALADMLDDFPRMFETILENLPKMVEPLVSGFIKALPKLIAACIKALVTTIPRIVFALGKALIEVFIYAIRGVFKGFADIGQAVAEPIQNALGEISGKAGNLFSISDLDKNLGISDFVRKISDGLDRVFTRGAGIFSQLASAWHQVWGALKNAGGYVAGLWHQAWDALKSAGNHVANTWHQAWDSMKSLGGKIWASFQSAGSAAGSFLSDVGKKIKDGFQHWMSIIRGNGFIAGIGEKIYDGLKHHLHHAANFFKNLGKKIADGFKSTVGISGGGSYDNPLDIITGNLPWKNVGFTFPEVEKPKTTFSAPLYVVPGAKPAAVPDRKPEKAVIEQIFKFEINIDTVSENTDKEALIEEIFEPLAEKIRAATEAGQTLIHVNGVDHG